MRFIYSVLLLLISINTMAQPKSGGDINTNPLATDQASQSSQLSAKTSALKQSVLDLNKDLYQLEEELLSPATTRVAVYFSLNHGEFFEPHSISIRVDNNKPIEYLYTERQVSALREGAVQPLSQLNLGPGLHTIKAIAKGEDKLGKKRELVFEKQIEKLDKPLYLELKIQDKAEVKAAELLISQW